MKTYNQFVTESINASMVRELVQMTDHCIREFKHFHWNLEGREFLSLHELYGEICVKLGEFQDRLAEKLRSSGYAVIIKPLPESELAMNVDSIRVKAINLLVNYRDFIGVVATEKDLGLENILGELAEQVDGWIYKLKSTRIGEM